MAQSNVVPIDQAAAMLKGIAETGGGDDDPEIGDIVYVVIAETEVGTFLRGVFTDLVGVVGAVRLTMEDEDASDEIENVNVLRVPLDELVGLVI